MMGRGGRAFPVLTIVSYRVSGARFQRVLTHRLLVFIFRLFINKSMRAVISHFKIIRGSTYTYFTGSTLFIYIIRTFCVVTEFVFFISHKYLLCVLYIYSLLRNFATLK